MRILSTQHFFSLLLATATASSVVYMGGLYDVGYGACSHCGQGDQAYCDSCDSGSCPSCGLAEASCEFPSCGVADACCSSEDATCGVPDDCCEDVGCGTPVVGNCPLLLRIRNALSLQRIRNALFGCWGCGPETYWSDWHNDPPYSPQGNDLGSRSRSYQAPYRRHPQTAGGAINFGEQLREANGQGEPIYR